MATRAPLPDSPLAQAVKEFCLHAYKPPGREVRNELATTPLWRALNKVGTALWLDSGDSEAIEGLWTREFQALTTNNTLLNKEVQKGLYDDVVPDAARRIRDAAPQIGAQELVAEIAFVLNALHGLKLVTAFDADVSVELHTDTARDVEASYAYGKRFAAIEPDRFIVKVPLTPEGLLAARRLSADGIRVNFTLGFSARQNYVIANLARPTYVNVFMGRINSFVADNKLGDGTNFGEKATLASQRAMRSLAQNPGIVVKQIGASMRSGRQCFDLMGLDVFTMPIAAAQEFLAMNIPAESVVDRTATDPEISLEPGRDVRGEGLQVFWEIDDACKTAACRLAGMDVDTMTAAQLRTFFADQGLRDLFPTLDQAEQGHVSEDGKIPNYTRWNARVRAGTASWDGLLSEAALASFAADQKKLDDRIREHLR